MTRQITPEMAHDIYMSIFSTEEEEFKVDAVEAKRYTDGIKTLAVERERDTPRLDALLKKIGDSRCISLFVMPAKPWSVPATTFWQYDAAFQQYFERMVNDFKISHVIFGNGAKYSYREKDDNDVTLFLELKRG